MILSCAFSFLRSRGNSWWRNTSFKSPFPLYLLHTKLQPFSHLFGAVSRRLAAHHMSACLPIVPSRQLCCGRSLKKILTWNSKGIGFHGIAIYLCVLSRNCITISPLFLLHLFQARTPVKLMWVGGRSYPPFSSSPLSWWTSHVPAAHIIRNLLRLFFALFFLHAAPPAV